jgi:DNA-binding SARP family transcriptional activator
MDIRLLGALEVAEHGRSLALGGTKQRSVLAILALHANQAIPAERLVFELWGERPPASAAKSVQIHISRLRKELGTERIETAGRGYLLRIAAAELDLTRFHELLEDAARGDAAGAARLLREALALWRGPPLADLAYEPFAQTEIARLEELRVATLEARIDADLAAGRHGVLVGELEALVAAHPLREGLRGQLMLALYRSGRQAEALAAYRAARARLADELGLEPGEPLRRLEQAILRQDPSLAPAPTPAPAQPGRSLVAFGTTPSRLEPLLAVAGPLAGDGRELIVACVVAAPELGAATAALDRTREELHSRGIAARTAAFASPQPGQDIARLAARQGAELVVMGGGRAPLEEVGLAVLEHAPCDVALLVDRGGGPRAGPVLVPFGAAPHDWTALELGAAFARATGAPLRLIGAAAAGDGHDASRLLADASLILQRRGGMGAQPLLAEPGHAGIARHASDAGLLVVGLPDRWHDDGLGAVRSALAEAPPSPMLLVRRGTDAGGLAPAELRTRFSWSLAVR